MNHQKTTPLIFFVLSVALLGGCGQPEQPIPPGAAKLVIPEVKPPALPLANTTSESRNAMTLPQRFNNDVTYNLRQIDPNKYGDTDAYPWGAYFCEMRKAGYSGVQIQNLVQEQLAGYSEEDALTNSVILNETYKEAVRSLCPANAK